MLFCYKCCKPSGFERLYLVNYCILRYELVLDQTILCTESKHFRHSMGGHYITQVSHRIISKEPEHGGAFWKIHF